MNDRTAIDVGKIEKLTHSIDENNLEPDKIFIFTGRIRQELKTASAEKSDHDLILNKMQTHKCSFNKDCLKMGEHEMQHNCGCYNEIAKEIFNDMFCEECMKWVKGDVCEGCGNTELSYDKTY